jgi:hypothetical protein
LCTLTETYLPGRKVMNAKGRVLARNAHCVNSPRVYENFLNSDLTSKKRNQHKSQSQQKRVLEKGIFESSWKPLLDLTYSFPISLSSLLGR